MNSRMAFQPWLRAVAAEEQERDAAYSRWMAAGPRHTLVASLWNASPRRVSRYLSELLNAAQRPVVP